MLCVASETARETIIKNFTTLATRNFPPETLNMPARSRFLADIVYAKGGFESFSLIKNSCFRNFKSFLILSSVLPRPHFRHSPVRVARVPGIS